MTVTNQVCFYETKFRAEPDTSKFECFELFVRVSDQSLRIVEQFETNVPGIGNEVIATSTDTSTRFLFAGSILKSRSDEPSLKSSLNS